MPSPSRTLRVASNLLVPLLQIGAVIVLIEVLLIWFGFSAPFSCMVLPVWQELMDPLGLYLAIGGLVLWLASRLRSTLGLWTLIIGLVLAYLPTVYAYVVDPIC